jgi:hypothetical protein
MLIKIECSTTYSMVVFYEHVKVVYEKILLIDLFNQIYECGRDFFFACSTNCIEPVWVLCYVRISFTYEVIR